MAALNVKFEREPRLAVNRSRNEHVTDRVGESDGDRKTVVMETRVEVDLRQTKYVSKDRVEWAIAADDPYQ